MWLRSMFSVAISWLLIVRDAKAGAQEMGELDLSTPLAGMGWTIFFIAALIGAAALLHRRFSWSGRSAKNARLQMVSALSLGEKRALMIVEAEGKKLLVGVTPSRVNLLCRLPKTISSTDSEHSATEDNPGPYESKDEAVRLASAIRLPFPSVLQTAMERGFRKR